VKETNDEHDDRRRNYKSEGVSKKGTKEGKFNKRDMTGNEK
jgi:hypothetical protein